MKAERRSPCGNCPFRKDAPLAYWAPSEYLMLQRLQATEGEEIGSSFGCHKDRSGPRSEQEVCIGWLLYQREHGVPSLAARLLLMRSEEVLRQFEESESCGELYTDISELVRDNIEADMKKNPDRYED